jgi:hypothetical protein
MYDSSSWSAHYSPPLDIDLSNFSPSRSILGYSHPAPASRPSQIVTPPGLRASYTTFTETRSPLQYSFTPAVLRLIWPAHYHFSMLIRCAMSVTLVLCRITWFRIGFHRETPSSFLSSLSDLWTCGPAVPWVSTSGLRLSWPVESTDWRLVCMIRTMISSLPWLAHDGWQKCGHLHH